uniref:FYVE, RhoGEF and PH domain containing 4b n=1 Tax=Sparus aurata TaxID=8175 RepID=A0A671YKP8_SPAAU
MGMERGNTRRITNPAIVSDNFLNEILTLYNLAKCAVCVYTVPPKPAHLQSPLRAGQPRAHSPTTGKVLPQRVNGTDRDSPDRGIALCVSCISPTQNCLSSPSPVRGGGNSFLNGVSGLSPARHTQRIPNLTSSPVFGSPSPGKRGLQSCSLLKEGGHSPAKLSPRNHSPLAGKLRTPSPVQWRMGSYSPAKNSKSWLGLPRISSCKMDGKGRGTGKSLSVPDLEEEEEEEEEKRKEMGVGEPKDEENPEQKLYKIANELLQTERAYVARLHLLDQVFCLRLTEEAGRGSFPPEVIRNIFSNISSIYSFHGQFLLPDLENCISHWSESPGLGKVMLQHAPFLRMYADYVRNFDQAMELVRTWTERSSAFRNIIQDIQSQEECCSLTLQHHMLEPVQRVPRYEMLLRDYLKKLSEDNPDYEFAHKSLQTISMAATHSNSAIHRESLKRLLEIYEMVGEEEVVNPTNDFLREGRLLKLAARNTSAMERHLFLFNNFLLCCTPKFSLVGQRFTVRCRIGVDGMQVQQTTNDGHPYSFQVSGKEKTLELQASSEQDRDEWLKVIQGAIDVFQKKHETFKLASKELNVEEPTEELGRRAPRWIRDNEVTLCMKCQEPFNALTRRRHHCRACGCVVCWKCSDNKVALEYDGNKLNKVCKACYSILTQRGERVEGKKRRMLEMSAVSCDSIMSGFLLYSDNPKTWQQVWSVLSRTEPLTLCLYAAPQDEKPLSCIRLLGCSVEDSPQELQGHPCFCLSQSRTTHTFSCEGSDLKQSWMTALKAAVTGRMPAGSLNYPFHYGHGCFSSVQVV